MTCCLGRVLVSPFFLGVGVGVGVCGVGGLAFGLAFGLRSAYAVHCAVTIEPDVIMKSLVQYLCRWTAHAAAGDLLAPSDTTYSHAKAINSNSAAADREPRHSVCSRWLRSKPWAIVKRSILVV